jgi:hypothetical protein
MEKNLFHPFRKADHVGKITDPNRTPRYLVFVGWPNTPAGGANL